VLSNSYLANIVGGAQWGGRMLFSFIKDVVLEDDLTGGPPECATPNSRGAIGSPVEVTGNVVTRANALSCMENAIILNANHASALTDVTRKITSNLFSNMDTDAAAPLGGVFVKNSGTSDTRNIDFYHNIIDGRGNVGNTLSACVNSQNAYGGVFTAFYNQCLNFTESNSYGFLFNNGTIDEGYNRFLNIFAADPVITSPDRSMAATDVDSDLQNIFGDPWSNNYQQLCEGADKRRNPWGGPVGPLRFGINAFAHFHPAVLPIMDADVFKMRYNWTACGAYQQDAIPR